MRLTRKADYGLRALYYIACRPNGRYISVEEIGRSQRIPGGFLAKLLNELVRGGLLDSRRGQEGGVRLVRPASEITMLDVIEVLDGPMAINRCLGTHPSCAWISDCPMRTIWAKIQETIEARLRAVTLARLARQGLVPTKSRHK